MSETTKTHVVTWKIEPGNPAISVATCSCGHRNLAVRSPRAVRWQRVAMQTHVRAASEVSDHAT